jgi:hypothetical protein
MAESTGGPVVRRRPLATVTDRRRRRTFGRSSSNIRAEDDFMVKVVGLDSGGLVHANRQAPNPITAGELWQLSCGHLQEAPGSIRRQLPLGDCWRHHRLLHLPGGGDNPRRSR